MIIFKKAADLEHYLAKEHLAGRKSGFAPTMGALHKGHLSLLEEAKKNDDLTVCSIFVNPTQFNNPDDLKHYPVTIEKDIELLLSVGCDVLFLPPVSEIYPAGYPKKTYDLGRIETLLEGAHRPGHFQGVCQVVERLLQLVQPNDLYIGQKDFQQCLVITKLVQLMHKEEEINIHIVPTYREVDGLAMSSRNLRLTPEQRQLATAISKELALIKNDFVNCDVRALEKIATDHLSAQGFIVDYVSIASQANLEPLTDKAQPAVALIAAALGSIRLIDNLLLN